MSTLIPINLLLLSITTCIVSFRIEKLDNRIKELEENYITRNRMLERSIMRHID